MATKGIDPSQGNVGSPPPPAPPAGHPPGPPPGPLDHRSRPGNAVFKSGPLFISSKGIGWTSWKKRWFILTHTSLVFFRSDPSAIPQKGSEVNLTLGGIDLNNSGSVVVKADKKLLTVLFPDGRDGRAFTLKAETLEDLYEWKTALEKALAQAPSTASVMGQNSIFKNDQAEAANAKDKPVKFTVIGRPILLALEDVDGTPSFLEKALRFIEEHGVKVEGILRQAADVDDVERRIRAFEQGKTEFSPGEDAHIVADCVKYVIRELPSSPVPASCCNALLEARRTDRGARVNAIRTAICETFPEPNRRLLQRILTMMQAVSSHKAINRMSTSAVAACMAPLLLRPLLAGDCEIETDFDVGVDGSVQLLQAAAAANHAQAIVITLLEEYDNIFGEGSVSPGLYSEESGSETEEATDDDGSYEDDEHDDTTHESDACTDDDLENASSGSGCESSDSGNSVQPEDKDFTLDPNFPESGDSLRVGQQSSPSKHQVSLPQHDDVKRSENILNQSETNLTTHADDPAEHLGDVPTGASSEHNLSSHNPISCMQKSTSISNGPVPDSRRLTVWGRTAAKKNLSMESIDYPVEDEAEIQRLEATKFDLQNRIADEVKGNEILQAGLERRKKALHERRLALEKDVARLQVQLQNERNKKTALEAVLHTSQGSISIPANIDEKTKVELEEMAQAESEISNLKQKVDDLEVQLNKQLERNYGSTDDSSNQLQQTSAKSRDKQTDMEASATPHVSESSTSKQDICLDGAAEIENHEKKRELTSLPNKNLPQNQQMDSHNSNSKTTASSNSKKSGTRGEGSNSSSFALTKLTNRLNFLKERRSQIASELQNIEKGRGAGQASRSQDKSKGPDPHQSDKSQGSEVQYVPHSENGREGDSYHSLQDLDKCGVMEGQSLQKPEKFRKSNSHSLQNTDGGRRSDGHRLHALERGRSEGHVNYDGEQSQGLGGQTVVSSRTYSR